MFKKSFALILFLSVIGLAAAQTYNKIGDVLTVGDHSVKIIDIGSLDVHVEVDGKRGTIFFNTTELINGVNVTVNDIIYHGGGSSIAWLTLVSVYSTKGACTVDSECNDNNPCTLDRCTGNPKRCDYADSHFEIDYCLNGDSCCPAICNVDNDNDCSPPAKCNDASDCRDDRDVSTYKACESGQCAQKKITECISWDGYCPDGCYHSLTSDQDCSEANKCINNTDCEDSNPCTLNDRCADPGDGVKVCQREFINECRNGDACCPQGCSYSNDLECNPNGEINNQVGGTPSTASCRVNAECNDGETCVDSKCEKTSQSAISNAAGFFTKIIDFLKRLFIPQRQ